jgi:hypothetical protein
MRDLPEDLFGLPFGQVFERQQLLTHHEIRFAPKREEEGDRYWSRRAEAEPERDGHLSPRDERKLTPDQG